MAFIQSALISFSHSHCCYNCTTTTMTDVSASSVLSVTVVVVVVVYVVVIDRVQDQLEAAKPGPLVDEVVGIYSHLFH